MRSQCQTGRRILLPSRHKSPGLNEAWVSLPSTLFKYCYSTIEHPCRLATPSNALLLSDQDFHTMQQPVALAKQFEKAHFWYRGRWIAVEAGMKLDKKSNVIRSIRRAIAGSYASEQNTVASDGTFIYMGEIHSEKAASESKTKTSTSGVTKTVTASAAQGEVWQACPFASQSPRLASPEVRQESTSPAGKSLSTDEHKCWVLINARLAKWPRTKRSNGELSRGYIPEVYSVDERQEMSVAWRQVGWWYGLKVRGVPKDTPKIEAIHKIQNALNTSKLAPDLSYDKRRELIAFVAKVIKDLQSKPSEGK